MLKPGLAPAALRGRRVLLVEDSELNRLVEVELLRTVAGMQVSVAANGREALERLRGAAFDLVLMDIQMPGIDGLQATRLIRADPTLAHLPVIAMTAHATPGDRDRSRAAGMNDHVGKPFDPAQLFDVMLRWLAPVTAGEAAPLAAPVATVPVGPGLDLALGLRRCLGRPELYQQILARYLNQRTVGGNPMRIALESGGLEIAARAAHSLISTASMIGAPGLADLARELHDAIDSGSRHRWPALLARIEEVQREVDAAVNEYLRNAGSHEPSAD